MKRLFTIVSVIVLVAVTACSGLKVISDYDREADFSGYSTFNFKAPENTGQGLQSFLNPLNQRRIEAAVTDEMALRDYIMSNRPDLWITYGMDPGNGRTDPADGILLISIKDSRTNKIVWSGSVEGALKEVAESPTEAIREAVEALMVRYPYLAAKSERFDQ